MSVTLCPSQNCPLLLAETLSFPGNPFASVLGDVGSCVPATAPTGEPAHLLTPTGTSCFVHVCQVHSTALPGIGEREAPGCYVFCTPVFTSSPEHRAALSVLIQATAKRQRLEGKDLQCVLPCGGHLCKTEGTCSPLAPVPPPWGTGWTERHSQGLPLCGQ